MGAQDRDRILAMADILDELWTSPEEAHAMQVMAMAWMGIRLFALSLQDRAETFHARLCEVEEQFAADPSVHACIAMERLLRRPRKADTLASGVSCSGRVKLVGCCGANAWRDDVRFGNNIQVNSLLTDVPRICPPDTARVGSYGPLPSSDRASPTKRRLSSPSRGHALRL